MAGSVLMCTWRRTEAFSALFLCLTPALSQHTLTFKEFLCRPYFLFFFFFSFLKLFITGFGELKKLLSRMGGFPFPFLFVFPVGSPLDQGCLLDGEGGHHQQFVLE